MLVERWACGFFQLLSYTWRKELRKEDSCAQLESAESPEKGGGHKVMMAPCGEESGAEARQEWNHTKGGPIKHVITGLCLESVPKEQDALYAKPCKESHNQVWWFEHYSSPKVQVERSAT